jgi:hypothetical protein
MARAADRDHATKQLEVAFDVYAAHGASADALRIARHLNSLGVHRRVVRQRAHTGWDSLTESELRLLELVADGATNRDAASELCVSLAHHQHPAAKRVRQARPGENHHRVDGELVRDPGSMRRNLQPSRRARRLWTGLYRSWVPSDHYEVFMAFHMSLADGGWPSELADEVATENLDLARWLPTGTVVERKLDGILVRAVPVGAPSPEQR